jgi:hypothetical protein
MYVGLDYYQEGEGYNCVFDSLESIIIVALRDFGSPRLIIIIIIIIGLFIFI